MTNKNQNTDEKMVDGNSTEELTASDYYFDSYSHFGIHEEMLKDEVRTMSYRNAIYQNRHLFHGKVVLDVGCGTGILSMFAAKAGAKQVIGVDMSQIIHKAREIVRDNKLDHIVTLLQGKMEEVVLPVDKVDIIISEWMGYFLLYESMLDTVLYARDKYLVPGGLVFPDKATMKIAAIEDEDYKNDKIHFWDNVYGFDMSAIKPIAMREPLVDTVDGHKVCVTDSFTFKEIDITTVTKEDLKFLTEFKLVAQRNDFIHAFIAWFDCTFSCCHKPVHLSTGPFDRYTHWKQTVFYLKDVLSVNSGEEIHGSLYCAPNKKNPRELDIRIKYAFCGANMSSEDEIEYHMC